MSPSNHLFTKTLYEKSTKKKDLSHQEKECKDNFFYGGYNSIENRIYGKLKCKSCPYSFYVNVKNHEEFIKDFKNDGTEVTMT